MNEWKLVPVEPTEDMIVYGFESVPHLGFSDPDLWDHYSELTGCQQAAMRAKLCWAAMLAAAPQPPVGREPELFGYVVAGSLFFDVEVIDRAAYTTLAAERDALQSELTKVRELLGLAREYGGLTPPWREAVSYLLAHQSAPAPQVNKP
ncbi:hypothetical protein [Pseudomonas typographi]|uniref:hypothetical protein n=1 Tax=Pseudomonas typographi TaxID=2715964 RepID=UPI0016828831|nr:hypothetical protein [Pseudomonas typographi]MBD1589489.1 hypothetical protein [Pseudomonas typographi]